MNLREVMRMSQQMQSRMADMKKRLASRTVTASSGGGMVEVAVDGEGSIKGVSIDPAVVDPDEVEMLEDLIVAATSEAQRRARKQMEKDMRKAAGGLPLPGMGGGLGGLLGR